MKPKRERFIKVGSSRVQKVLDSLESLSKCSNRANYEYTDAEVRKMERALRDKMKETFAKFGSGALSHDGSGFKF